MKFQSLLKLRRRLNAIHGKPAASRTAWQRLLLRHLGSWYEREVPRRFGGRVPIETSIGKNVEFPHEFYGVFLSRRARIGDRVRIMQNVTIGANLDTVEPSEAPTIADDVFIGVGALIIGRCVIGNGARIGAGVTLVNATIAPGTVIVNNSAYNLTEGGPVYPPDRRTSR